MKLKMGSFFKAIKYALYGIAKTFNLVPYKTIAMIHMYYLNMASFMIDF